MAKCDYKKGYSYMVVGRKGLEPYSKVYENMCEATSWHENQGKILEQEFQRTLILCKDNVPINPKFRTLEIAPEKKEIRTVHKISVEQEIKNFFASIRGNKKRT